MRKCPICKAETQDWEALCKACWKRAEEGYKLSTSKAAETLEYLRGQAKSDLMDMMRTICKLCDKFKKDLSDPTCEVCVFKEKERLIRAFIE